MQLTWYDRILNPGNVVIDVGAHGGRHTARMSVCVGKTGQVTAFEPLPEQAAALRKTFFGVGNVVVKELALSNQPGKAEFFIPTQAIEESGLRQRKLSNPNLAQFQSIQVELSTLDVICGSVTRLDLIKIDVEGAEMLVLSGGAKIVATHRPAVFVEHGVSAYSTYGVAHTDLYDWAVARDYCIFDLFGVHYNSRPEWANRPPGIAWDYVLVPEERSDSVFAMFGS